MSATIIINQPFPWDDKNKFRHCDHMMTKMPIVIEEQLFSCLGFSKPYPYALFDLAQYDNMNIFKLTPLKLRTSFQGAELDSYGKALNIDKKHYQALTLKLKDYFSQEGISLYASQSFEWIITCDKKITTTPIYALDKNNDLRHHFTGEHKQYWQRILSELEMLLYMHFNAAQDSAHEEIPFNSFWLWGESNALDYNRECFVISDDKRVKAMMQALSHPHFSDDITNSNIMFDTNKPNVVYYDRVDKKRLNDLLMQSQSFKTTWIWRDCIKSSDKFPAWLKVIKKNINRFKQILG